jgi:hypothetical protein
MLKRSFALGQVVATPAALALLAEQGHDVRHFLQRHACGDWGDIDAEDWQADDTALAHDDGRLLSSYAVNQQKIWILTESDRSSTCIMVPGDY